MPFRVRLVLTMAVLVAIAILPVCFFLIQQMRDESALYCSRYRDEILGERQNQLRCLVEMACNLTRQYIAQVGNGELSAAEARRRVMLRISAMRFDEGRGYFWIHEYSAPGAGTRPAVIMHPTSPAVVNRPIDEFYDFRKLSAIFLDNRIVPLDGPEVRAAGLRETQFLIEMNRTCAAAGEGFVTYYWTKPMGSTGTTSEGYPKLAFVKLVPEWDWVIGLGIYIDDLDAIIQQHRLAMEQRVDAVTRGSFLFVIVAMAATLFVGILFTRGMARSVQEIDGYARAVTRGDYPRDIVVSGSGEFRAMRAAFRQMVATITTRENELRARAGELEQMNRQLDAINRMKTALIANVSHELRTPLVSIRGYCEMLAAGDFGPLAGGQRDKLDICIRNSDLLLQLINDLMSLSEAAFDGNFPAEAVDLSPTVQNAVDTITAKATRLEVAVAFARPAGRLLVAANHRSLERVFLNLLANAVKFSPARSRVLVSVEAAPADPQVAVRITDSGIGITAVEQERIFDRFYQVDSSYTRKYGGLGLGLALVKETVEHYGGTVTVQSELGRGTTFTVRLNRWAVPESAPPAPPRP